jgi:hypothetical protein
MTSGPAFNPAALVNNSPNNTGLQNLPPAQPALVWYPYNTSTQFPELGSGGRTMMAGPVYHFDPHLPSEHKLPAYYDGTLFLYEWSRSRIWEVKLDDAGNLLKINDFTSSVPVTRPMDMEVGPDGRLYILEWGTEFNGGSADARLVRVDFLGQPTIVSADFDASGSVDGGDFLIWQRGLGITGGASRQDGDANLDGGVDAGDLDEWRSAFGSGAGGGTTSTAALAVTTPSSAGLVAETASTTDSLADALQLPAHLFSASSESTCRTHTANVVPRPPAGELATEFSHVARQVAWHLPADGDDAGLASRLGKMAADSASDLSDHRPLDVELWDRAWASLDAGR